MVFKQDRYMARFGRSPSLNPSNKEVGEPNAFIPVLSVGPTPIVLNQKRTVGNLGMASARFDLLSKSERGVDLKCQRNSSCVDPHKQPSLIPVIQQDPTITP
jgi:hypothetical protein